MTIKKYSVFILLAVYAVVATIVIFVFNGTGGEGDSITHFLFARYAPVHPELFFDHWAKPVFVLLSSPFAQFGFNGIKVFNVLVSMLTIYFTYRIACKLNLKNEILSAIFLIFSPLYFILTFSGLTEPLFALFVALGIYFALKEKYLAAAIIISFLPFIRSEGLIIIGIFGFYFLLKNNRKSILLLLTGHIVYSLAGYFIYHDILWVFTKIPYNNLGSPYGHGDLFHFFNELIYVTGVPGYVLFWTGYLFIIFKIFKRSVSLELVILIFLGFSAYFTAHTLFWYLGIFNSMGLKRVLIGVMPLIAIISLTGFDFITGILIKNLLLKRVIGVLIIIYVMIFPFLHNPASVNWKKDMMLTEKQKIAKNISGKLADKKAAGHRFVFSDPYLSLALNIDYFDTEKRIELTNDYLKHVKSGDIIIWDNWFSKTQLNISRKEISQNSKLQNILSAESADNKEIMFLVYQAK